MMVVRTFKPYVRVEMVTIKVRMMKVVMMVVSRMMMVVMTIAMMMTPFRIASVLYICTRKYNICQQR